MRLLITFSLLAVALASAPTRAAQSYDNCTGFVDSLPAVIATQGTWCLRKDLATAIASGNAITIATNNVTLDCNHFKIGGLAAGAATNASGVRSEGRMNFTLRHCHLRGFSTGAWITGGAGHVVESNRFEGNTTRGIVAASDQTTVRGNTVMDTGGSTSFAGEAIAIQTSGLDNHVLDNLVAGISPSGGNAFAYGILMNTSGSGTVGRNAISGLSASTAGPVTGIYAGGHALVHDNRLQGLPAGANSISVVGINCASNQVSTKDNLMSKFDVSVFNCYSAGDVANPN